MSDRLKELQRQRALVQEHLAWLDREIARETGGASISAPAPVPPAAQAPDASPALADADRIIEQYQSGGTSIKSEVKRGCFLYFFAAFALLGLAIAVFYLLWRR